MSLRDLAQAHLKGLSHCPTPYSVPAGQNGSSQYFPGLSAVPPLWDSGTKKRPVDDAGTNGTSGTLGTNGTSGTKSLPVDKTETDHRCACGGVGVVASGWFLRDQTRARWTCSECFRRERQEVRS